MAEEESEVKTLRFVFSIIISLLLLVGCRTVVAVPQKLDISQNLINLYDARPVDDTFHITPDVNSVDEIVRNSSEYLRAWMSWENYAYSLEDYLNTLSGKLMNP